MIKKLVLFLLLLLTIIPCLRAQRKEISQARSYIKSGKELAKAEEILRKVIDNDSVSRNDPRVHSYLLQAIEKQYAEGNEKLYLKQKYDTTVLFSLTKKLFDVAQRLDSLDSCPNKKGVVKTKYRTKNAAMLDNCRTNLFFGGTFHLRKGNYEEAFSLFDIYINSSDSPMFAGYNYSVTDKRLPEAGYWASYSAANLDNPQLVLKHARLAERDTSKLSYILMYEAEAYSKLGDTEAYVEALKRGFELYPTFQFFFPHLIDHFLGNDDLEEALALADRAVAVDSTSILFLYAKSNVLLNMGKNDECIDVTKRIVELNDTLAEPYYNIGMAFLNKVVLMEKSHERNDKNTIKAIYRQAMPYLEKYRVLAPDEKKKWAPALYRVYLNLNMGKQFDEIDRIINEVNP